MKILSGFRPGPEHLWQAAGPKASPGGGRGLARLLRLGQHGHRQGAREGMVEPVLPLATWIVVFVPMPLIMALALLGLLLVRRGKRE